MEVLSTPVHPWDDIHHRSSFLPQYTNVLAFSSYSYAIEAKYFIPPNHIDWFKYPIPALDPFKEGSMHTTSPTIKVDIYVVPVHVGHTFRGASCLVEEVAQYKTLFE